MKKVMKKNNRTSRIIALLLVLVMIITPMMSYDGKREGAKAATSAETFNLTTTVKAGSGGYKLCRDSNTQWIGNVDVDVKNIYCKGTLTGYTATDCGFMNFTGDGADIHDGTFTVLADYLLLTKEDKGQKAAGSSFEASKVIKETTQLNAGEVVYVYVNPSIQFNDLVYNTHGYETLYTLIGKYTINYFTAFDETPAWSTTTSPATTASVTCTPSNNYAGVVKCGYSISSSASASEITWEATPSEAGTYYGYAGYFANNTDTEPIKVSATVTSEMVIDKTAPQIVSTLKLYKNGAEVINPDDAIYDSTTGIYYVNGSGTYEYEITVTDNNGGTGSYSIDDGAYTAMSAFSDVSGTQTVTQKIAASDSAAKTVVVKDAAGNTSTSITLPKIQVIDKTFRFTGAPYLVGIPTIASGAKIKDRQTVKFAVESPYLLTSFDVITGTDMTTDVQTVSIDASAVTTTPYGTYQYTGEANIPVTSEHYKEITKIEVQVTNTNPDTTSNTLTASAGTYNYIFDDVAPVISSKTIKDDIVTPGTYADVASAEIAADGSLTIVPGDTLNYRYYVTATDDGVGIASVEGSFVDDMSSDVQTFTQDGTTDNYYLTINDAWLPTDGTSKTLYVKVTDKVGNATGIEAYGISVKAAYTDLQIDTAQTLLKKGNGTPVVLTEIDDVTNEAAPYTLTLQASSAYRIKQLYIEQAGVVYKSQNLADDDSIMDYKTKRYTASYEFEINPADIASASPNNGKNIQLNDWVAYAADAYAGHTDVSANIGKILYDNTMPVVTKLDDSPLQTEAGWYNTLTPFTFSAKITSGPQTVESSINAASYTISDSASADGTTDLTVSAYGDVITDLITVPESAVPSGTVITFAATDKAGNTLQDPKVETVRVDNTAPVVTSLKVNGSKVNESPLVGFPTVTTTVTDKLALKNITIRVKDPNGNWQTKSVDYADTEALASAGIISKDESLTLEAPAGMSSLLDGSYYVEVTATDKAGNPAIMDTTTFKIDNTIPVVTAKIASGTMGGKRPGINFDGTDCDYYYRSNVGVQLTYDDDNIAAVLVTDNGKLVDVSWTPTGVGNKQIANLNVSAEGAHTIKINAIDESGNKAVEKQVMFIRDVNAPTIKAIMNGGRIYTEGMGTVDMTSDVVLNFSVSDANEDKSDFNYRLTKKLPDQPAVTGSYMKTTNRTISYTEEADYTVNVYSVDMANNVGPTREISFRVDKFAPEISINGAGGTTTGGASVSFNMKEAFWWDASGSVTIYRKAGDASVESQYKQIDYKPTAFNTTVTESLTETGVYRIEFTARDRAGHTATTSQTVTIDREAPVIKLSGVDNYDKTNKDVTFMAEISDDFYTTKKVYITGTREDASGKKNKIEFSSYNQAGNPTIVNELFKESGIYDIEVTSEDAAGNKDTQSVHFTIDKDKPEIGKLPIEENAIMNTFDSVIDLDELVSDLTVCDVHMYMNGVEYDGDSELEDGSYTLLITAEDELGNYTEKSVSFELDTKCPVFIVTGVEDGEVKNEAYSITVSLQIEDDTLADVQLNGKTIDITDNTATIEVTEKGNYELTMSAVDKAQNYADQTISFKYGEKNNIWIWIVIGACGLLLIGGIVFIVLKKKKNN